MGSSDSDDYVEVTGGSADELSYAEAYGVVPSSDSSDTDDNGDDFFTARSYANRDDIRNAVVEYNDNHGRAFSVLSSDHRRYKAVCVDPDCDFVVAFAFGRAFGPPTRFVRHTCDATAVNHDGHSASRARRTAFLIQLPEVRQFVIDNGRNTSPTLLKKLLVSNGRKVSYRSCVEACNRLKKTLFEADRTQYQLILSYTHEMNKRGHKADITLSSNVISRVIVVYKQGIQAASVFAERGFSVDGTFMKHEHGGTLLVACFLNSNGEIQIVAVAWVSGENKDNWSWFLTSLLQAVRSPSFVISDRDKGLIPAMEAVAPTIHHFVCLRHMMENFNMKFRNKALRDDAWRLGKSLSLSSYQRRADALKTKNAKALEWMEAVSKVKWSATHSPCTRFGTMTSNNVESTNNVLLAAREMPLLDCLMHIEKYVGGKWVEFVVKSSSWNQLTAYAHKKFITKHLSGVVDKIEILPSCATSFVARVKKDSDLPVEYTVDLDDRNSLCSCGYYKCMKAPCVHVIAALKCVNKLSLLWSFFDDTWSTDTYRRAYDPTIKMSPFVTKDDLLRFELHEPPPVPKKRGRPKNSSKRIESQPASLALKKQGKYKCGQCGGFGHNKRACTGK